ncbi:MAG: hypothetical protein KDD40_11960, partial [Bdellovibrionales bacterium]|nr:hypothetical protein [Bdellovibrionales bacterium]
MQKVVARKIFFIAGLVILYFFTISSQAKPIQAFVDNHLNIVCNNVLSPENQVQISNQDFARLLLSIANNRVTAISLKLEQLKRKIDKRISQNFSLDQDFLSNANFLRTFVLVEKGLEELLMEQEMKRNQSVSTDKNIISYSDIQWS